MHSFSFEGAKQNIPRLLRRQQEELQAINFLILFHSLIPAQVYVSCCTQIVCIYRNIFVTELSSNERTKCIRINKSERVVYLYFRRSWNVTNIVPQIVVDLNAGKRTTTDWEITGWVPAWCNRVNMAGQAKINCRWPWQVEMKELVSESEKSWHLFQLRWSTQRKSRPRTMKKWVMHEHRLRYT